MIFRKILTNKFNIPRKYTNISVLRLSREEGNIARYHSNPSTKWSPTRKRNEIVHKKLIGSNDMIYDDVAEVDEDDEDGWEEIALGEEEEERDRDSLIKFVDKVALDVKGGRGGNGCISYEIPHPSKKIPTGGSGGRGGNVYVTVDKSLISLNFRKFQVNAGDGEHGKGDSMTGRNGKDIFIKVPLGTIVSEKLPGEAEEADMEEYTDDQDHLFEGFEMDEEMVKGFDGDGKDKRKPSGTYELNKPDDIILVAEGGVPGIGNKAMKGTSTNRRRSLPASNIPGQPGQARSIQLELKLIADVGLVGYPNAGKSSLLRGLSNARPKVAAYPFTTLHPSVGIVNFSDFERITVADIPGIIDGAHRGRGLGLDFLRHIERTKVLLYVIDIAGTDERAPDRDLKNLINELRQYDPSLLKKPSLVFGNKDDLEVNASHMRMLRYCAKRYGLKVLIGSTSDLRGIEDLACELRRLTDEANAAIMLASDKMNSSLELSKREDEETPGTISLDQSKDKKSSKRRRKAKVQKQ